MLRATSRNIQLVTAEGRVLYATRAYTATNNSDSQTSSLATGLAAAGMLSLGAGLLTATHVNAESAPERKASEVKLDDFLQWLHEARADLRAVDIRSRDSKSGLGVFLKPQMSPTQAKWWAPWTWWRVVRGAKKECLARFPLKLMITANCPLEHPDLALATLYGALVDNNTVDEQALIMLHLMVERARGTASEIAPYIAILPSQFTTPIFFTANELELLRGTPLFEATKSKQRSLQLVWEQLEPAAKTLWRVAGIPGGGPTISEFAWAYSIYWSRALAVPDPNQPELSSVSPSAQGDAVQTTRRMVVGLIPGLDCCNHVSNSNVNWTVFGAPGVQEGTHEADMVSLVYDSSKGPLRPGDELRIDYGQKGNEELLFIYGFVEENNPYDRLMVHVPLPQQSIWADGTRAKLALLEAFGLSLQYFLDMPDTKSKTSAFSRELMDTMLVMSMSDEEAQSHLSMLEESFKKDDWLEEFRHGISKDTRSNGTQEASLQQRATELLVDILRKKVAELQLGTGPMAVDIGLLKAHNFADLPYNIQSVVRYRYGQKLLANELLAHGEEVLSKQK